MEKPGFKVLIIGGSLAGLTLAHCLEHAGIAYTVLEKHSVAPELGASLGIMPNGGRILDQLGVYADIEAIAAPLKEVRFAFDDGYSFVDRCLSSFHKKYGYCFMFLERRRVLEVLYARLRHKSAVLTHKEVVHIEQTSDYARVTTKDGLTYDGDIVVGADGVHSIVRSAMWRAANQCQYGRIPLAEQHRMFADYSCTFGISAHVKGITVGEVIWAGHDRRAIIAIPSKDGGIFWFLIAKLEERCQYPNVPRYSHADAIKVTPELGQGANMAIEDAAALSNVLRDLLVKQCHGKPSVAELDSAMETFNRHRLPRATIICRYGSFLCRLTNRDGVSMALLSRYVVPHFTSLSSYLARQIVAFADIIGYIEVPIRAGSDFEQPIFWGIASEINC
ncbi:hypothetical protein BBP40_006972 [Aspergillus hancockii]|nr:hypothetical protein BBP40_006972 [Aspergillus hancockii]